MCLTLAALACLFISADAPFGVRIVDDQTGRGVPLVEVSTVNELRFVTDSNGLAAINEPGLFGQEVFFRFRSHGYAFPKDGFGYPGQRLEVVPGKIETVKIRRLNVAERLYRITGEGIYRDSVLLNQPTPTKRPVLNAKTLGSDSVQTAFHRGRIHWFWGDTNKPSYPLGNFHVPGAISKTPEDGGLDPGVGVDLEYYLDETGFARPTAKMPGEGPTWIDAVVSVPDRDGRPRLLAKYAKIRPPLSAYERGFIEFDDEAGEFRKLGEIPEDAPVLPKGHAVVDDAGGYVYFANPYPYVRAPASAEAIRDIEQYEAFTCLKEDSRLESPQIERGADGRPVYAWKRNAPPVMPEDQERLVEAGSLRPAEGLLQLRDVQTDRPIRGHSGSVNWNEFRQRWVMIALELFGEPSVLGEIWYAEADALEGPWVYARRVVTHDKYSFYNPMQHPYFDQKQGRLIYFEGTYTEMFSGAPAPTPRYEYNQLMYRLDLEDPRMRLPVAYYAQSAEAETVVATFLDRSRAGEIRFFAWDRPTEASMPVYQAESGAGPRLTLKNTEGAEKPAFHAIPLDAKASEDYAGTVPLYEYQSKADGTYRYDVDPDLSGERYDRRNAVCRVWPNPLAVTLPHEQPNH